MPQIVELPDKTEIEFPDGMDHKDISAAIIEHFPDLAPKAPLPANTGSMRPTLGPPGSNEPVKERRTPLATTQAFDTQPEAGPDLRTPKLGEPPWQPNGPIEIPRFGQPGTVTRGVSEVLSGLGEFALNKPEEFVGAMLQPEIGAAIAIRYATEIAKQFSTDVYDATKGDKQALGRVLGIAGSIALPVATKRVLDANALRVGPPDLKAADLEARRAISARDKAALVVGPEPLLKQTAKELAPEVEAVSQVPEAPKPEVIPPPETQNALEALQPETVPPEPTPEVTNAIQPEAVKADREKLQDLANKPLVGSRGDIGQGDLLGEGDLLSGPKPIGMGGAVPEEFAPGGGRPTSNKNAVVDRERAERGLEPLMAALRRSQPEAWEKAMAKIDLDPEFQDKLIAELEVQPRPLFDWENSALLQRRADLRNEFEKSARDAAQAFDDGRTEDLAAANIRTQEWSDKLSRLEEVTKPAGSETGRALAARKQMMNEDYTLASLETNARAAKGGAPLTDAERAELVKIRDDYAKDSAKWEQAIEGKDKRLAELEADKALAEMRAVAPKIPSHIQRIVDQVGEVLHRRGDAARERLKGKLFTLSPELLKDLAEVGADNLWTVGYDIAKWTAKMVVDLGEKVRPHLDAILEASRKVAEGVSDKAAGAFKEPVKQAARQPATVQEARTAIVEKIGAKVKDGDRASIGPLAQKLARSFVESGIKTREALVDAVHEALSGVIPDLTRRETMDAISGYGEFKQLTKDQISVELRDLKGQMQQVAKLEDMRAGQAPLKTGVERRSPSDEERRLLKQVNEAKKKGGFRVTDPATQLRSALQTVKTRLENQIRDLAQEIATRTKTVREKRPVPTDAEVQGLIVRRDALKAEHDSIFGKPEMTDAQRIKLAMGSVERSIAEYERRIAERELKTPKAPSKTPITPELTAARARRQALRDQLDEMRDLDQNLQAEKAARALESERKTLEKTIAEQERRLREGDLGAAPSAVNRPSDPTLEPLKQKRDALNKQLAEARKPSADQRAAAQLQARLRAIEKAIEVKEAKVKAGDISTKAAPANRPLSPELEAARQKLDALDKQLSELRKAANFKTPDELANKAFKSRTASKIAELEEKMAAGDFRTRKPRAFAMDSEAVSAQFALEKVRQRYNELLFKFKLSQRTTPEKIIGVGAEVMNTFRAVLTGVDLSAVLRQGKFVLLAHPIRAAKVIAPMLRALMSEKAAFKVAQEIRERPNFPLYKSSKLYLSDEGTSLSKMEEAYMSRWAAKIPLVAASQRAYTTFLNKLRADSFDAMAKSLGRGGAVSLPEAKILSNFINVATGRGTIGLTENAAVGLNTVFFAPRYVASRFQMLLGQPLYHGIFTGKVPFEATGRARAMVAGEYGRILIGAAVVYGLGRLAGADIELDPRSSDFGKLKFGNTRIDPMAGVLQVSVLLSRLASGKTKSLSGKVTPIRGKVPFGGSNAADVLARFARTKLAPVPGTVVDVVSGKDVVGNPVTPASVAQRLFVPLSLGDIYETMREQGVPKGTAISVLSIFGESVQNYEPRAKR